MVSTAASRLRVPPASAASPTLATVTNSGPRALVRRSGTERSSWSRYPHSECAGFSRHIEGRGAHGVHGPPCPCETRSPSLETPLALGRAVSQSSTTEFLASQCRAAPTPPL